MFSAHLFDYSSKPLYYHPDKNHIIIVTTTWKRHTFSPNLGHVYIYIKNGRERTWGSRRNKRQARFEPKNHMCIVLFFFTVGKRRGPSLTETVYGVRTRTVHSLWGKKLTERKKNTKLRHAYIIIIIGYLTTSHSSTKECVTPFFLFSL